MQQKYKKKTKQIRIGEQIHREFKIAALKDGKTISTLADEVLKKFLIKGDTTP